jgi:hypothetical protein
MQSRTPKLRFYRGSVLPCTIGVAMIAISLGSPGVVLAGSMADPPDPAIVATFYFGGTFMEGDEWKDGEAKWGTPSLWESMNRYAYHRNGALNNKGIKTYHYYHAGIGAWYAGLPAIPGVPLISGIFGDMPHCRENPRGWDEVHNGSLLDLYRGGALNHWQQLLNAEPDGKIIVNSVGQSRGGMSAIRFAQEISNLDPDNRIAWINVISTDPVWDENFPCLDDDSLEYSLPEHFVLSDKVRNYIGIYAEDERASDFHPIVPKKASPSTKRYLLTVPGSHQTLVGNPRKDGHAPSFHNWLPLPSSYKRDATPLESWRKVYRAVTWMVLKIMNSPDFGYTIFWSKPQPTPNLLAEAVAAIEDEDDWKSQLGDAQASSYDDYVQTMSFLPRIPSFKGKLTIAYAPTECILVLGYWNIVFDHYTLPRCGVVATGTGPSGGTTLMAGLDWSAEVHQNGETIFPRPVTAMWDDVEEVFTRNSSFTISAAAGTGGRIEPDGLQQVDYYGNQNFTVTIFPGYLLQDLIVDGESLGPCRDFQFTEVRRDHTIRATFDTAPPEPRWASAGPGGEINPSGKVLVNPPSLPQTRFQINPDWPNSVADVVLDKTNNLGALSTVWLHSDDFDESIEAFFSINHELRVVPSLATAGTIVGPGIDCPDGGQCTKIIPSGGEIVITSAAEGEYAFAGWTGCDQVLANPAECRMIMPLDPEKPSGNRRRVTANFILPGVDDEDGDSVDSSEEANVPDHSGVGLGDGNGDGALDSVQSFVASAVRPGSGNYHTIDVSASNEWEGAAIEAVLITDEPTGAARDPDFAFPFGVLSFRLPDTPYPIKRITIHSHGLDESSEYVFRMFDSDSGTWYTLSESEAIFTNFETDAAGRASFVVLEYEDEDTNATFFGGPALLDTDRDDIGDAHEAVLYGTNRFQRDTDGDGLDDKDEISRQLDPAHADTNRDFVRDGDQLASGGDPIDPDTDHDGMPNAYETLYGLDPLVNDTLGDLDSDGVPNGVEFESERNPAVNDEDWDQDGMPNDWEVSYLLEPEEDDSGEDPDGDGLTNLEEYLQGLDPTVDDTDVDSDGILDHVEGRDALPPPDRDGDGVPDWLDFDPTGYFYDEQTGRIVSGGQITIDGPAGLQVFGDGSDGYYRFTATVAGTYTITPIPPQNYMLSTTCLQQDPPPFDPTLLLPTNPVSLGNGENMESGFLTGDLPPICTEFYLRIDLEPDDPIVINNNIPLQQVGAIPTHGPVGSIVYAGLIALLGVVLLVTRRFLS